MRGKKGVERGIETAIRGQDNVNLSLLVAVQSQLHHMVITISHMQKSDT